MAKKMTKTAARSRREELVRLICEKGETPRVDADGGKNLIPLSNTGILIEGLRDVVRGGGSWFVIEPDYIWFVWNNGGDGDLWAASNVASKPGVRGTGTRLPFDQGLADEISLLDTLVGERRQPRKPR